MHIKPGDVVAYNTFGGGERITQIVEHEDDVKNGKPGFTGNLVEVVDGVAVPVVVNGVSEVWGYDEQITRVIIRATVTA